MRNENLDWFHFEDRRTNINEQMIDNYNSKIVVLRDTYGREKKNYEKQVQTTFKLFRVLTTINCSSHST